MTPAGRVTLTASACALALSCGTPSTDSGDARLSSGTFVAVASDFRAFRKWEGEDVTDDAALAGIHDGSTVIEYLNKAPAHGATEFPLGTIIVKEATGGTIEHELFAMVKRGGKFNAIGVVGWEWFDLAPVDNSDQMKIVWRGFGPPEGDTYGGDASAGCNTCHAACNNDAVCAKPFLLTNF